MEIFIKKLTSVDIEKQLDLPNDTRREALPPFNGSRDIDRQLVLPNNTRTEALPFRGTRDIVIPITFGHDGVEVDVHCSCRAGRIAFTRGWVEIARNLSFNAGDFVALRREDNGKYKMTVRSGSA